VPYLIVVGDKEVDSNAVSVENREGQVGSMSLSDFIETLTREISTRALNSLFASDTKE
jgi:threonyl-tRNA synthetase